MIMRTELSKISTGSGRFNPSHLSLLFKNLGKRGKLVLECTSGQEDSYLRVNAYKPSIKGNGLQITLRRFDPDDEGFRTRDMYNRANKVLFPDGDHDFVDWKTSKLQSDFNHNNFMYELGINISKDYNYINSFELNVSISGIKSPQLKTLTPLIWNEFENNIRNTHKGLNTAGTLNNLNILFFDSIIRCLDEKIKYGNLGVSNTERLIRNANLLLKYVCGDSVFVSLESIKNYLYEMNARCYNQISGSD